MRLASYITRGRSGFGAVVGNGVVDMRLRFGPRFTSLLDILRDDALAEVRAALAGVRADYPLAEIELLRPVVQPEKIICVGNNYVGPGEPLGLAKYPNLFFRTPKSLVGHLQPILRPQESEQLDCEAEIALVIGREGRRIPRERAFDHVAGYTLCNEGTVRDWMQQARATSLRARISTPRAASAPGWSPPTRSTPRGRCGSACALTESCARTTPPPA